MNKGLDLTDESYYLMGYRYPELSMNGGLKFQLFYSTLFSFVEHNAISTRLIRLILTLFSSFVFSQGLLQFLKSRNVPKSSFFSAFSVHFFIGIGSLLTYSFAPQSISYNSLSLIFGLFALGFFLMHLTSNRTQKRILYSSLVGAAGFCLALVKFTIPALLFTLLGIVALTLAKRSKKNRTTALFSQFFLPIFISFAFFSLLFFKNIEGVIGWINEIFVTIKTPSKSHSIDTILSGYQSDIKDIFIAIGVNYIWLFALAFLAPLIHQKVEKKGFNQTPLLLFMVVLGVIIFDRLYMGGTIHKSTFMHPYFLLMTTFLCYAGGSALIKNGEIIKDESITIIALLLFIMPFLLSFGTNNDLFVHIIIFLSFWFAGLMALAHVISPKHSVSKLINLTVISFAVVACAQTVMAVVFFPYRLSGTLLHQTHSLSEISDHETVKVDEATFNTLKSIKGVLTEKTQFDVDKTLFVFRHQTGIAYALNATTPTVFWYAETDIPKICSQINKAQDERLREMIFIIPKSIDLFNEVKNCSPHLDQPYERVATLFYPLNGKNDSIDIIVPVHQLKSPGI
ncbi:MAG: hypothetical protein WEC59_09060 [Salibacteraceae bacterium]